MKRTASSAIRSTVIPPAWRAAEYAALRVIAADTCDDRVSDSIFDAEDERAEIDRIVHYVNSDTN